MKRITTHGSVQSRAAARIGLISLVLLILGLTGCTDKKQVQCETDFAGERVLVLLKTDNYYWRQVEQGILGACLTHGLQADVRFGLANGDAASQVAAIESIQDGDYLGVILAPSGFTDPAFMRSFADLCQRIPTVIVDSKMDVSNEYIGFVGTNNEVAGDALAKLVFAQEGAGKRIGVVCLTTSQAVVERVEGFTQYMQTQDVVLTTMGVSSLAEVPGAVSRLLADGCDALFLANATSATEAMALTDAQPNLHCYSFDINDAIKSRITNGSWAGTVLQDTYGMGAQSVHSLINHLQQYKQPKIQYMNTFYITKDNMQTPEARYYINEVNPQ